MGVERVFEYMMSFLQSKFMAEEWPTLTSLSTEAVDDEFITEDKVGESISTKAME